jgi:hypothetical protein
MVGHRVNEEEFSRDVVVGLLHQLQETPLPHLTPNELEHLSTLIQTTLEVMLTVILLVSPTLT